MKTSTLLITLLIYVQLFAQKNKEVDFFPEIIKQDISRLLMLDDFLIEDNTFMIVRPQPLGFIGKNYKRFHIRLISVIKNSSDPTEYLVYGKTKVGNNIRSFQGKLHLKKAKIYNANNKSIRTSEYQFLSKNHSSLKQGVISGKYEFYEDPNQKESGVFKGDFKSSFYLAKDKNLEYDILMWNSDDYKNNQFQGTWNGYMGVSKECNWGDFRIPHCGDLDVGTQEFIPNEKYLKYGWSNYQLSLGDSIGQSKVIEARRKEDAKWWLER